MLVTIELNVRIVFSLRFSSKNSAMISAQQDKQARSCLATSSISTMSTNEDAIMHTHFDLMLDLRIQAAHAT